MQLEVAVTTPEPTVRPPSRIAKRSPSLNATGELSVTPKRTPSPGRHMSASPRTSVTPVTSVVRKKNCGPAGRVVFVSTGWVKDTVRQLGPRSHQSRLAWPLKKGVCLPPSSRQLSVENAFCDELLAMSNSVAIVDLQQSNRCSTFGSDSFEERAIPFEVI